MASVVEPRAYENRKARNASRQKLQARKERDIAPDFPAVVNPERKARAAVDFRYHCEVYHPHIFTMPWSDDHLRVIKKIEDAVFSGGLFAMAMPRGTGKTTISEVAAEWATCHGHVEFGVLLGATEAHGSELLESIKTEFETNDLLLEDFPEVCYPILRLENVMQNCAGQHFDGQPTNITWTSNVIVLPTIPSSKASGAIIKVAGITGRIRGMKFKRPDGRSVRPSLVIPDDPQTDESAKSVTQSAERERILAGAVLGLAGPGKKISGVMPCTVIRPGDMADRILDRDKHPEWNGERTKMVYAFPSNEKLWEQYRDIRNDGLREGDNGAAATEFYREHQGEMDTGAVVAWKERFRPDELSAIQHAMNLLYRDKAAFFAEYQNEPLPDRLPDSEELTVDVVLGKLNGYKREAVSVTSQHVVAFIDIQQETLWWTACAFDQDFTGGPIDYGVFPQQNRSYFTAKDARWTLSKMFPRYDLDGRIYAGLAELCEQLLTKEFRREDGAQFKIERCLPDANWGQTSDTVKKFCRQSKFSSVLLPSRARYVGAGRSSFNFEAALKVGDRGGARWRIPALVSGRDVRQMFWDTNFWKSRVARAFQMGMGDKGTLTLFGDDRQQHELFADHMTSEFVVRTQGRGSEWDEWQLKPGRDNHWWDCLVGCYVAASERGCEQAGTVVAEEPKKRIKMSELQAQKRQRL